MALKFNTKAKERLKLKAKKYWQLIPIFVEVIREKLVGGLLFNITNLICDTLNMLLQTKKP